MFRSLRRQLNAILFGFLILVVASAIATFVALETQAEDATVINLAGRQRMLVQQMTWLALSQPESPRLDEAIQVFDSTLAALRHGGETVDAAGRSVTLSAVSPPVQESLEEIQIKWIPLRHELERGAVTSIERDASIILHQLEEVVNILEAEAQAKIVRLRLIQIAFLATASLLLLYGYLVSRRRVFRPLNALEAAAHRIGSGDLEEPVKPLRNDELGRLAEALEKMRGQLADANLQLEARITQRGRELETAFEFSQEIVSQLDLEQLLSSVTARVRALLDADSAALCLLGDDGNELQLVSTDGTAPVIRDASLSAQHPLARKVLGSDQPTLIEAGCATCSFLQAHNSGRCVVAPLAIGPKTVGSMCAVKRDGAAFDANETRAMSLLANAAAVAIANARLAEAGRRQAEQNARLAERERLAAGLHDTLAQTLGALRLKTDRLAAMLDNGARTEMEDDLRQMRQAMTTAYGQLRAALTGLRQPPADNANLLEEVEQLLEQVRQEANCHVQLETAISGPMELSPLVQTQALHIVREALTNVRRHAAADTVSLRVVHRNNVVKFYVTDDGRGFDPRAVDRRQHLGLTIMETRAERCGGQLALDSRPGKGTSLVVTLPAEAEEK